MPRLGILVEVEEAYTQCPKALLRSELWNSERHIDRSELPSSGEILRSTADPELDVDSYEDARARAVPPPRRVLLGRVWRSQASSSCSTFRRCSSLNSKPREQAPGLGDVVVLDGRLEVLAHRDRLPQLPAQPAEKAHLRGFHRFSLARWSAVPEIRARAARPRARTAR